MAKSMILGHMTCAVLRHKTRGVLRHNTCAVLGALTCVVLRVYKKSCVGSAVPGGGFLQIQKTQLLRC